MAALIKRTSARKVAKIKTGLPTAERGATLTPGPYWTSFEKFRVQGSSALTQIKAGSVGTLASQGCQFRILREGDFQHLIGLVREVDRVRQGLRVVHAAVQTVQEHPGQSSVSTLVEAALLLGTSSVLPVRHQFAALQPEQRQPGSDTTDDEDDVEINPQVVRRLLDARGMV